MKKRASVTRKESRAMPAAPVPTPLRPRRALFMTLLIIFGMWIAVLLVLYFTTVGVNPPLRPDVIAPALLQ